MTLADPTQSILYRMARYWAGDFSNREQAWENPPFFSHIQVCYRPLPWSVLEGFGFYLEQAYAGFLEDPYRTAVLQLTANGSESEVEIRVRNYQLHEPQKWLGSARQHPERLAELTSADLVYLAGCDLIVRPEGDRFVGEIEPGKGCCVARKGQNTYLHTTMVLSETGFLGHDRGFDPQTHEQVWGAIAGPFEFVKLMDLADGLDYPA
jgi:hypothetical protein